MGEHRFQNVIPRDQQARLFDLAGRVAVANVPGQTIEIAAFDLDKVFRRGPHADGVAIIEDERIARVDRHGFGQIDNEGKAVVAGQLFPAKKTPGIVEREAVTGRCLTGNLGGAGQAHACPRGLRGR